MTREIEGEHREAQTPHCPTCDRPLKEVADYPKIKINKLVFPRIPNYVRDMPSNYNIAKEVKGFAKLEEVQNYLLTLYGYRTFKIVLSDIKPDLPEYQTDDPDLKGFFKLKGRYYLHVLDTEIPNVATVSVMKHVNTRLGWGFTPIANIAEIHYTGILNN